MTLETLARRHKATIPTYRSDNWRILSWMVKGHKITVMQCVRMFNTPNLRSRISELERYGWPIHREPVKVGGNRFNRYYMR